MKVFTLTLFTVLLIGFSAANKLKKVEKRSTTDDESPVQSTRDDTISGITDSDADKKDKGVHKRGVFHYGSVAGHPSVWPKSYAAHYGYGLHLPASVSSISGSPLVGAHAYAHPAVFKYNAGLHYKALASPSVIPTVTSLSSAAVPAFATLGAPVSHGHHTAAATPFIIRPGSAVIQSYSINYPHQKSSVAYRPVHAYASVQPLQTTLQSVPTIHGDVSPVQSVHPLHHVQSIQPLHHVQPFHHFDAVQPVQPVHGVQSVHPIQPIQPVQPVHPVVQVRQHYRPFIHHDVSTQQLPSFFQTTLAQPTSVPITPAQPFVPALPAPAAIPAQPAIPVQPALPAIPTFPQQPQFPNIPDVPVRPPAPALPQFPTIPHFPSFSSFPDFTQNHIPGNGFFPVQVQPPLPQEPPTFSNFNPVAQTPVINPGTSSHNIPDFGSANASPQIPAPQPAPLPEPQPEFPQPTQQPWKPVGYQPTDASTGRPSHTLLPPYGNTPTDGYLPPAPPSSSHKLQHELGIDSELFDNLSDAEIRHIFKQASLAAQRDRHRGHTLQRYHSG